MTDDELVVVGEFQTRVEAEIAHGALQAADIESVLSSDDVGGQYAGVWVDGVRLLVRAADRERAAEVLGTNAAGSESESVAE